MISMHPPTGNPLGKSWDYWMIEWWKWLNEIPAGFNPCKDQTGEFTSTLQPHLQDDVWFLAGTQSAKAERTYKIPSRKSILLGVATMSASKAEFGQGLTQAQLLQLAKDGNQVQSIQLTLGADTLDHQDMERMGYHKQTSLFNATLPRHNIWHWAPEGETQAIADGYWAFLKPLPAANYLLHVKQSTKNNPNTGTINCNSEVKHNLVVY